MPQLGIPYILTGPDGTRAVFNDPTSPDFCGYLDSDQGITGLLDTADVREGYYDHVEGDGGVQTDGFFSRRTGTMQGFVIPDPNMLTYNIREAKIKRASRGMRSAGPAYLTWTPDGSIQRQLRLYRQGRVAFTGRRPKNFVMAMSSPDPYIYSTAVGSLNLIPSASAGDGGFTNPMTNPITTAYNSIGSSFAVNQGDAETWPIFTINGPMTNPTLVNHTTGLTWTLTTVLGNTDVMVVNSLLRTVYLNGNNAYAAYAANFLSNTWWSLFPGSNDVRISAASFSGAAQATIAWQHAWE